LNNITYTNHQVQFSLHTLIAALNYILCLRDMTCCSFLVSPSLITNQILTKGWFEAILDGAQKSQSFCHLSFLI